jgi:bifunctional enzyme CysN/CysC
MARPATPDTAPAGAAEDIDAYLARNERKDLVRLLTAGSVDDGKSTLIGRLLYDTQGIYEDQLAAVRRDSQRKGSTGGALDLSLLMDGLRAEREQGITIDVAYRYFSTANRKFIIADCPGHEQYTRNMATGASNCDLAVILIDARHGVQRQTKRHSFIVSLLGIRHVVVAVNKMDLVDWSEEVFERIKGEYTDFATRLEIGDLRFTPMSALTGDNVVEPSTTMPWYEGETLLHYLETVHIASDRNLIDLRFPVQYVNRPNLDFRGFSGTIASGIVRPGDEVMAVPSGQRSRVRTVVAYEGELAEAYPPMAVTVTLEDEIDVSRGDTLVHPGNVPRVDRTFEAMLVWMAEEPLTPGKAYLFKQTTNLVSGQVTTIHYRVDVNTLHKDTASALAMNEVGRCRVTVNRPLAFDPYRQNRTTGAFIVIDRRTNRTVGAGMILDRPGASGLVDDNWAGDTPEAAQAAQASQVTPAERAERAGHRGVTVLLTGLVGSGKTTIAYALERRLFDEGRAVCVLDGRQMRQTISRDLGFSAADRSENLRRSADVARYLNDAGLICIASFLAPTVDVREKARLAIGAERFLEVHIDAPIEVCRARDREGWYAKADAGEIPDFPGVTGRYEPPASPALRVDTTTLSVDASVDRLIDLLRESGVFL